MLTRHNVTKTAIIPIPNASNPIPGEYVLATGENAVRRLHSLHDVYSPAGKRVLRRAGLREGMRVADFGCGIGATTQMLAEMVGFWGSVVGIDSNAAQLREAEKTCGASGFTNTAFVEADACETGLARESFDVAYCRFLLIHLPDPAACLREMHAVLKPGGLLIVEDGDLSTAGSSPASALNLFSHLFERLGPLRGVDYCLGRNLYRMVKAAGFSDPDIEIHQPAIVRGENRHLLKWSVEEAAGGFVTAGLITELGLQHVLNEMQAAIDDPEVLILAPRMSMVWARKES
jgi:ubiquinone/menaquinone biosynthesis C-methylase UbiE